MRSLLASLWDAAGLRSTAEPEDYDPDAVLHVADDADGFYGAAAYCGYVFTEDVTRSSRVADYCPACVDVLGHVPGELPPDDGEDDDEFDDVDEHEWDDFDDEDENSSP